MRRILVAVDGSEIAMRALDFAAEQAALVPRAQLHVLSVLAPAFVYDGEAAAYTTQELLRATGMDQCRAVLQSARERVDDKVAELETEVLEGDPADTIVRRAAELECEAIVMGTHGRGRLGQALLGSVAQRVVHMSHVPVTLVR